MSCCLLSLQKTVSTTFTKPLKTLATSTVLNISKAKLETCRAYTSTKDCGTCQIYGVFKLSCKLAVLKKHCRSFIRIPKELT